MSREIKFRAWDKENKSWYHPTYEAYKGKLEEILIKPSTGRIIIRRHPDKDTYFDATQHSRFVLMQYTGRKDRNGEKIYDGDIVSSKGIGKIRVSWDEEKLSWSPFIAKGTTNWEIIGNIYENKELLK